MLALPVRQRGFVIALLELGGQDFTRAAKMAGYGGDSPNGLRTIAHRLAHDTKVQAAMLEEAQKRLGAHSILCTSTLIQIINGEIAGCTVKDRTKAIEMLLNRTGLHALTEHKVQVEHTISNEEALRKITLLAGRLGIDPAKLLGTGAPVLEGEFADVTDDSVPVLSAPEEPDPFANEFTADAS